MVNVFQGIIAQSVLGFFASIWIFVFLTKHITLPTLVCLAKGTYKGKERAQCNWGQSKMREKNITEDSSLDIFSCC